MSFWEEIEKNRTLFTNTGYVEIFGKIIEECLGPDRLQEINDARDSQFKHHKFLAIISKMNDDVIEYFMNELEKIGVKFFEELVSYLKNYNLKVLNKKWIKTRKFLSSINENNIIWREIINECILKKIFHKSECEKILDNKYHGFSEYEKRNIACKLKSILTVRGETSFMDFCNILIRSNCKINRDIGFEWQIKYENFSEKDYDDN